MIHLNVWSASLFSFSLVKVKRDLSKSGREQITFFLKWKKMLSLLHLPHAYKKKAQIDTSKVYTFTYSFLLSNQRYLLSDAEPKAIYMNVCVCKHWRKCVLKGETKRCSSCQTQDHYQRRAKERKKGRQDRETLLRATITRCRFMQPYSCGSPA